MNLYVYVGNDGASQRDFLGLIMRPAELELREFVGDLFEDDTSNCWQCVCPGSLSITLPPENERDFWKHMEDLRRFWGEDKWRKIVQHYVDQMKEGRVENELGQGESVTRAAALFKAQNDLRERLWRGTRLKPKVDEKPEEIMGGSHRGYAAWKEQLPFMEIEININDDECKCRRNDESWEGSEEHSDLS